MHTGLGKSHGCGQYVRFFFSITGAVRVRPAKETEAAVIAAVRAGVEKSIQKNPPVEVLPTYFSGAFKEHLDLLRVFQVEKIDNVLPGRACPIFSLEQYVPQMLVI